MGKTNVKKQNKHREQGAPTMNQTLNQQIYDAMNLRAAFVIDRLAIFLAEH